MSGGHRKVSRSTVDNSLTVNSGIGCHFKQPENELKQKLDALDTSFKISNRKISNETRELKQILFGLQRDLKESKASSSYVPSIFEEQRGQVKRQRRITVAATSDDTIRSTRQTSPRSPVGDSTKRQRKTSNTSRQPDAQTASRSPEESTKRQRKTSNTSRQPDAQTASRSPLEESTKRQRKVSSTTYQPESKFNENVAPTIQNVVTETSNDSNVMDNDNVIFKAGEVDHSQTDQQQQIKEYKGDNRQKEGDGSDKDANTHLVRRYSNPPQQTNNGTGKEVNSRRERKISQPGTYSYSLPMDSKTDHTNSSNKPSTYGLSYSKHFNEDRKRSLSDSDASYRDAFRGRFVTHSLSEKFKDRCSIDVASHNQQKRTRRVTVASSTPPVGLRRPIDVADFSIADSRRKRNTTGRGPMGLLSTQRDEQDDVFDSKEGKNSLTVGRTQDIRQKRYSSVYKPSTYLPPLHEETKQHEQAVQQWNTLDQCRYLRKEDQILSIEDIFRKD